MRRFFPFLATLWLMSSCVTGHGDRPILSSINLLDHNGMSQTISSKDRLQQFQDMDFAISAPYQKVMRVYERDSKGNTSACITSYHPNGQIKQWLEVVNSRANGHYREWFSNGQIGLEAVVVGGQADLDPSAQKTWLFEGHCRAWDEEGHLIADFPYVKGSLEGETLYYHINETLWKRIPFKGNLMEGIGEEYSSDGTLLEKTGYSKGNKHGPSERFWPNTKKSSDEIYVNGILESGTYITELGEGIGGIQQGSGYRALFKEDGSYELQQYKEGVIAGKIRQYNSKGFLSRSYSLKNGLKQGEEITYYPNSTKSKLSIPWYEGQIQGIARTWYDNGQLESQREFNNNCRHGLCTAWYRDGSLMLIEEYIEDTLQKGEYHGRGESSVCSRVSNGKGVCTLFDGEGSYIKKIQYQEGKPQL